MAIALHFASTAALKGQFALWCRSCGASATLVRGLCAPCYATERHDRLHFAGLRQTVLERDRRACRACGQPQSTERSRIHVHHRRPGVSREKLLISLCPAHHAQVHRLQILDRLLPPLLSELWRELHPGAAEQLFLAFEEVSVCEADPAPSPVWLWEESRAG